MDDHGLSAAVRTTMRIFEEASRRSGRTLRMIERARSGDVLVTTTNGEARRIRRLLHEAGKPDIKVVAMRADIDPRSSRGTNAYGRTIFDHNWTYEFFAKRVEAIRDELVYLEAAMSVRYPLRSEDEPEALQPEWLDRLDRRG